MNKVIQLTTVKRQITIYILPTMYYLQVSCSQRAIIRKK